MYDYFCNLKTINQFFSTQGYIADEIKKYLVERGVNRAIIDLGGNVLCVGEKENGKPFHIGIQKPFADRNETIGTIEVSDDSVVSLSLIHIYFNVPTS